MVTATPPEWAAGGFPPSLLYTVTLPEPGFAEACARGNVIWDPEDAALGLISM